MSEAIADLGNEAFERINRYAIGDWMDHLFQRLGLVLPPTPVAWERSTSARAFGLVVTIYRHPNLDPPPSNPDDALVLAMVEGDATAPMPCGLSAATETPRSAVAKLSTATEGGTPERVAAGDTRVSYFMPDGKVVELRFNQSLVGFNRIVYVALGTASPYRA